MALHYDTVAPRFKDWETPPEFFKKLDEEFHFDFDAAASHQNHLCDDYATEDGTFSMIHPGLREQVSALHGYVTPWHGRRVFCNPPYDSSIGKWVAKAASREAEVSVLLLPPSVDTAWFHDYIWGHRCEVRFLRGRLKFWREGKPGEAPRAGNLIAIFRR